MVWIAEGKLNYRGDAKLNDKSPIPSSSAPSLCRQNHRNLS
jgi:hypothetical protein